MHISKNIIYPYSENENIMYSENEAWAFCLVENRQPKELKLGYSLQIIKICEFINVRYLFTHNKISVSLKPHYKNVYETPFLS